MPSLPCENQRVGLGTPLVDRRPASSDKLWKINAYHNTFATYEKLKKG